MKYRISIIITWVTSIIVGGAFAGLTYIELLPYLWRPYVIPSALVAMPLLVGLVTFFMRGIHTRVAALLAAATPVVLALGAFSAYVVVEGHWTRIAVAGAATGGIALFFAYWRGMSRGETRFREEDFAHLTLALHVFAMFFIFTTSFGVTNFLHLPVPASAAIVGLLGLVTSAETLRRSSVPGASVVPVSLALGAIMAQAYVGVSMLPTGNLVNALVGTVLYAATLHASLVALKNPIGTQRLGRQLALSLAVVVLVLSTARWA